LIVPTNTASYRSAQVPTQEVAAARMRAWETGRWVLEVTPTGYTAVISPTGRVVQKTALGVQRLLTATVPREAGRTVYVDIGDAPVALAALLLLSVGWALSRPPRASRHHDRWKFRL
jgi:apolipoprotein N-acyltransferase